MAKRKGNDSEEEHFEPSEEDDSEAPESGASSASNKPSKSSTKKKASSSATKKGPTTKKPKIADPSDPAEAESSDSQIKVHTSAEGDKYIDLGKKRRAIVRSFKGVALLDIREFYVDKGGEEKPGKKGISLTLDQWQTLKDGTSAIDKLFSQQKKK